MFVFQLTILRVFFFIIFHGNALTIITLHVHLSFVDDIQRSVGYLFFYYKFGTYIIVHV